MKIIPPTIGRKLWFYPNGPMPDDLQSGDQPLDATVVYVHNDRSVNLACFDMTGRHFSVSEVPLLQGDDTPPMNVPYCTWMPYQIGQAKAAQPH